MDIIILLEFLGGSEGMDVDIMWSGYYYLLESVFGDVWMWILLFARMFFGGVWMSGCGYSYLLQCFWGCLDVWIWILCGYYYLLECFLGESGCLDVDKPK